MSHDYGGQEFHEKIVKHEQPGTGFWPFQFGIRHLLRKLEFELILGLMIMFTKTLFDVKQ